MSLIAQNPNILGVGLPGPNETEMGTEPGGASPMLSSQPPGGPPGAGMPDAQGGAPPPGPQGMRKYMDGDDDGNRMPQQPPAPMNSGMALPDASYEDIKKYDLDIQDFEKEMDEPEIDWSEEQ